MDAQLIAVRSMLGGIAAWLTEIQTSSDHLIELEGGAVTIDNSAVTNGIDRINEFASVEVVAPYPRMEIMNGRWQYDFHMGNCMSEATELVTVELIRPYLESAIKTPKDYTDATTAERRHLQLQYLEIMGVIESIFTEFSRLSYQSGAQFAQAKVEVVAGPWFAPHEEIPLKDPAGNPLMVWWTNIEIASKSY